MTTVADFSGYATKNDLVCADGRTIKSGAFSGNNGMTVPLVWDHGHSNPENILGHAVLEERADGVYCQGFFNDSPRAQATREAVKHGDIRWLSIFANDLVHTVRDHARNLRDVVQGNIREVSLVVAGANPGAVIDNVNLTHGFSDDVDFDDEAFIRTGIDIVPGGLAHADTTETTKNPTAMEILDGLTEQQKTAVYFLLTNALEAGGASVAHSNMAETDESNETNENGSPENTAEGDDHEVEDGSTEDASDASNSAETDEESASSKDGQEAVEHNHTTQEDNSMTHNVFDRTDATGTDHIRHSVSPDDVKGIVASAIRSGSLKDAVTEYALQHNIENINYLFPDAKTLESSPAFISRRMEWVDDVLGSVRKSPFSRIKTITADITPDEARARGYITGNFKNEEYFALSKRETTPQTIYKKQRLDRDDVIDIVDLDVVAWLKAEMKVMLDEELAGAILVGDGRSIGDEEKIQETKIRPVATDAELYVTTVNVNLADVNSSVEEMVDAAIENRRYYKGSGQPVFYTTEALISKFLTVKDNFGRRIYKDLAEVASVLRVSRIVPVEVMERDATLLGIMVNLSDYTVGADRGGQATMFDDFDINYNKLMYLIETRCSGALTLPKSALVFRAMAAASVLLADPEAPTFAANVVTVPTVTHVTYKDGTGATLTTASPVTLLAGETLDVVAVPAAGYYFANSASDQWSFRYEA